MHIDILTASTIVLKATASHGQQVNALYLDSRAVKPGGMFFAIEGSQADGHKYISSAVQNGAVAVVCENMPGIRQETVSYIQVADSKMALGDIAATFYGHPSKKIKLIGIGGTNGKTSIVNFLYRLFTLMGHSCGMLSTINNIIAGKNIPATHTTPDIISINKLLSEMTEKGCSYCFMEVSSHALSQHRTAGLAFRGGVFTNISQDHLDYHKTFSEYLKAKKSFFDKLPKEAYAISNFDDKNGKVILQNCQASKYSYALKRSADFKAKIIENDQSGLHLRINNQDFFSPLLGEFNAYNLLAAYAVANIEGYEPVNILKHMSSLKAPEGRMQFLKSSRGLTAIVDYAHTPDALDNVLSTIKTFKRTGCRIISVFGAGGNRDKSKRPLMGKVAVSYSDIAIITSDNPRDEDPDDIIKDILEGITDDKQKKVLCISDRREAIKTACTIANEGDIILVAGKGHEKYQEVRGEKKAFDDKVILSENI